MSKQRVAIVHYWFISARGGEKVVRSLLKLYPEADVYTHVFDEAVFPDISRKHRVITSFISRLPRATRFYQKFLPLMPLALEQLDLRDYDLIISSESGPAKGVLTRPDALHVCYCHSPMRYLWDMYHDYRETAGRLTRFLMVPLTHYLRLWDRLSADRVDHFIANSNFVASRIRKVYRREAFVIHPPVDIHRFELVLSKQDYFVMLGQLTAYKRPDLAVEAFRSMPDKRLKVLGEGEMVDKLRATAPDNVEFPGRVPDDDVKATLQHARALIFPGVEDFGIVPVEAMACGTPVIAFGKGGATESVKDGVTGLLFQSQTVDALIEACVKFDDWEKTVDRPALRARAAEFDEAVFRELFKRYVSELHEVKD
ncbi:glycosyltransferase [Salinisphaera sp. Q1T1-3]|uniref:glycosyltransferase n=1 Tax=Salinisphaera sp. Q1T1-3 TaxID=2321229 RepID=UPI000E768B40|nr:glycosyltransferase [Salinisphaera sp. Q1T1-3]RJS92642.1 glycosyltransferase family 4 protein [Salinisphaera sp. Q1T1-3]